ncbi:MAG: chemotaxis protein CheX [Deltaproteobacteria bacterium]|nr:chemotaxis protein CheX [Deltaproteobacteria bacterium]
MIQIDQLLLDCVERGTIEGLQMTGISPSPVGASRYAAAGREYSVLVSLYGDQNGTMTLNMSRFTALFLASKMLGEETQPEDINEDYLDALCEIGNIVAGRFKDILSTTHYHFSAISLPALVAGANFSFYHYRGLTAVTVEFEIKEISMAHVHDRVFSASISLMGTSGK